MDKAALSPLTNGPPTQSQCSLPPKRSAPWDHRELRDDRVVYVATTLWPGTYTMTYVARATTPGVFVRPPVHAEEMYNPAVNGRSDGGVFTVTAKGP
jgi:uncharacterized protein YfaS (alpha-2-macroglobulin family)